VEKINYIEFEKDFQKAENLDSENKNKKRKKYLLLAFIVVPIGTGTILTLGMAYDSAMGLMAFMGPVVFFKLIYEAITGKEYDAKHAILKKNIKMISTPLDYSHILLEMIEVNSENKLLAEYMFLKQAYNLKADMIISVNLSNNKYTSTSSRGTGKSVESITHNNYYYTGTAVQFNTP